MSYPIEHDTLIALLKSQKRPAKEGEVYWAEHPDILWNEAIDRAIKAVEDKPK